MEWEGEEGHRKEEDEKKKKKKKKIIIMIMFWCFTSVATAKVIDTGTY